MLSISDHQESPELGGVLSVACGMYRYVFYRCVSVAWVVASFCLHSLSIFSPRLFSALSPPILIIYNEPWGPVPYYSILFYSAIFYYILLWAVACVMYRYVFLSVCVGCLGGCLVLLTTTAYLLFSSVLFFFSYIL